jgi:hypothetical protein
LDQLDTIRTDGLAEWVSVPVAKEQKKIKLVVELPHQNGGEPVFHEASSSLKVRSSHEAMRPDFLIVHLQMEVAFERERHTPFISV